MPLPDLRPDGLLPPGLHAATLTEVGTRFGGISDRRQQLFSLLSEIVMAAAVYPSIKRVLVWGSFVTSKREPGDLDYSLIVAQNHIGFRIAEAHRRFLSPLEARQFYGVDRKYLIIADYPLEDYVDQLDFLRWNREGDECGIVEISLRGESAGGRDNGDSNG